MIAIGKCDLDADPHVKVFYWQDDNTLPAAGKARVKALHGVYDTSPTNPILQIDVETSLEQMTFGYYSELYKQISGSETHVLNVGFDSNRAFNKTVFFPDRSVSTIVTAGSWADTFDIFVFYDVGTEPKPSAEQPQSGPTTSPSSTNNNSPKGSTSTASNISMFPAILFIATLAAMSA